jgi:uncharacterized protein involved in exopolysaccharide biosynthesis/Mrp family chromosome partitioning ATPase
MHSPLALQIGDDAAYGRWWHSTGGQDQARQIDHEFITLADILRFLKLYVRSIAACFMAGVAGAVFYLGTTDPIFTARTQVLIEQRISRLLQQATEVNLSLDTAQVESQIAVMQSEKIAAMVIDELKILHDPAFIASRIPPTLAERFARLSSKFFVATGMDDVAWARPVHDFASAGVARPGLEETLSGLSDFERSRLTMEMFRAGLDVRRVGVSYAIDIFYSSRDPEEAATLANATARAFVREQIESKAAAAREGGEWLERRMGELRTQMNNATQIAQQFRARHDYSIRGSEAELQNGRDDGPTLEELEVTAETYSKMYESYLQAFTSYVNQQSYPVADARVITAATPPLGPSYPRRKLVLAFGMFAGLVFGVGLAFLRHTFDRTLRWPEQVRGELGLECIGQLPVVRNRNGGFGRLTEFARSPKSRFSENLRKVKSAIALGGAEHPMRLIGVTSALPSDGKTSFASNLATAYSMSGRRTLVIDADTDHSALTDKLAQSAAAPAPHHGAGVDDDVGRNIVPAMDCPFDILPCASGIDRLASPMAARALLSDLQSYDVVIVDLPPLTAGADALAITSLLDGVVVVAEWGRTPVDMLKELVQALRASNASIIGLLMTKVRMLSPNRHRRFLPDRAR